MQIDPAVAAGLDVYHALVGLVTPRPIAWVTTIDAAGRVNLAPFSFFNAVSSSPPVVGFCPALKRDGTKKDSLANLAEVGEFVVNVAVAALAEQMNLTAKEVPHEESEVTLAGLHLLPSAVVKPPRVAESPAHLECRVRQIIAFGTGPGGGNLVLGDVVRIHIDDAVLGSNGRPDPRKLQTIARLGGDFYCRTTDLFEMPRP